MTYEDLIQMAKELKKLNSKFDNVKIDDDMSDECSFKLIFGKVIPLPDSKSPSDVYTSDGLFIYHIQHPLPSIPHAALSCTAL